MESGKVNEKMEKFTRMVLKDAGHKAGILRDQAQAEKQKLLDEKEMAFLEEAYHHIQNALRHIEKESNAAYSRKLSEVNRTMFAKRMEMIESVFGKVEARLLEYQQTARYREKLGQLIGEGLKQAGEGEIQVFLDKQDINHVKGLKKQYENSFVVKESDEPLYGGCIITNTTAGILLDYSYKSRLADQRAEFMENYGRELNFSG